MTLLMASIAGLDQQPFARNAPYALNDAHGTTLTGKTAVFCLFDGSIYRHFSGVLTKAIVGMKTL